ncbi:MAG: efflux RND transporter periplasmic adaptor subunit [Burkholderiaceae bacterium]
MNVSFSLAFAVSALGLIISLTPQGPAQAQNKSGAAGLPTPRVLLIPQQETTLVAPTGSQIRSLAGGLGSAFKKGSTLVRFDCSQLDARRGIANAELGSAKTNLNAKKRLKALNAAGDLEVAMAAAVVNKASAELKLADVQIQQCRVRAPFAGRVVKRHVRRYQGVQVGDPLLDIVATGPLKLRLNVPSRWLPWLKTGYAFKVRVDETGKEYPAKVSALNARVDAVSQSIEIEGDVQGNHPELLAGMSGSAVFRAPAKKQK